jgi:hypothetical protein
MMRRPEGPRRDQRAICRKQPENTVDLCDFERFFKRQRRQDRRKPLGEHALARPRRADQENIMPSRGRDLEGALGLLLPLDLRKIAIVERAIAHPQRRVSSYGLHLQLPRQQRDRLLEVFYGVDFE